VHGNDDGIVIGCVNQDNDEGMIYTVGSDWQSNAYDAANWTETNVSTILGVDPGTDSTWTRGVCRGEGNLVAAAGEYSKKSNGWLLVSKDGGTTWENQTDALVAMKGDVVNSLYQCQFIGKTLIVGGPEEMFTASF